MKKTFFVEIFGYYFQYVGTEAEVKELFPTATYLEIE